MVIVIKHKTKTYFQCEICLMYYKDKKTAQKCEDFCTKNNACNTEIIKLAIKLNEKNVCDIDCKGND